MLATSGQEVLDWIANNWSTVVAWVLYILGLVPPIAAAISRFKRGDWSGVGAFLSELVSIFQSNPAPTTKKTKARIIKFMPILLGMVLFGCETPQEKAIKQVEQVVRKVAADTKLDEATLRAGASARNPEYYFKAFVGAGCFVDGTLGLRGVEFEADVQGAGRQPNEPDEAMRAAQAEIWNRTDFSSNLEAIRAGRIKSGSITVGTTTQPKTLRWQIDDSAKTPGTPRQPAKPEEDTTVVGEEVGPPAP